MIFLMCFWFDYRCCVFGISGVLCVDNNGFCLVGICFVFYDCVVYFGGEFKC